MGFEAYIDVVGICLISAFLLIVTCNMIVGMRRGAYRQLINTGMVLLSALISFAVSKIASGRLVNTLTIGSLEEFLLWAQDITGQDLASVLDTVRSLEPETFEPLRYILSVPITVIIAPIMFVAVFLAARIILRIVQSILISIFKIRKPKNNSERIAGVCLACVEAILVLSFIIMPLTSVVGFVDDTYTSAISAAEAGEEDTANIERIQETYTAYLEPVIKSPAVSLAIKSANSSFCASFTSVKISGTASIDISEGITGAMEIALIDAPKIFKTDFKNLSANDKEAIDVIVTKVTDSDFIAKLISGTISTVAKNINALDVSAKLPAPFDAAVDDILNILRTCTDETLKTDIDFIKGIYYILSDAKILANPNDILDTLTAKSEDGVSPMDDILALVKGNPRASHLVTTLMKASLSQMANAAPELGIKPEEVYDKVRDGMTNVLEIEQGDKSHEEYIADISDTLDTTFKDHGINLDDEVITDIAEYIDQNYSDKTSLSDEEFNEIFISYYDKLVDYLKGDTPPASEDNNAPNGGNNTDGNEDDALIDTDNGGNEDKTPGGDESVDSEENNKQETNQ